jgi:hypothetical protein
MGAAAARSRVGAAATPSGGGSSFCHRTLYSRTPALEKGLTDGISANGDAGLYLILGVVMDKRQFT